LPVEVSMVLALYWITLTGLAVWLVRTGSGLDRRLRELGEWESSE
jgi:hypothetical protein